MPQARRAEGPQSGNGSRIDNRSLDHPYDVGNGTGMTNKGPKNTPLHGVMFAFIGALFLFACAGMLIAGKAGRNGYFSTPQNEPVIYWLQVGSGFAAGVFGLSYGAYLILCDRGDNDPPDSTTHT
jgi:hypothetical protein